MTETRAPRPLRDRTAWARSLPSPLRIFVATESGAAMLLLGAALLGLAWANSPWWLSYEALWSAEIAVRVGGATLALQLREWINHGLMTLFFFVLGLEIRRELQMGELRQARRAALPVLASVGGMLVPVLLYLAVTSGQDAARGWGIVMATDTAFALGLLTLVQQRSLYGNKLLTLLRPALGSRDDPRGDVQILAQREEAAAVDELQRLAVGELIARWTVAAGGDEDPLGGPFVLHGAVEVTDRGRWDGDVVQLGLDDVLAAEDRLRVVRDAVHAPVSVGFEDLGVEPHLCEQVVHEVLEVLGLELQQIRALVDAADDVHGVDDPWVRHVEAHHRRHLLKFFRVR
ncbi:MAG: hypothetical protein GEU94_19030 [Micromonosporaceae bacterium]|nr:hypothetical protein [Micromonosporaceae bacterium]